MDTDKTFYFMAGLPRSGSTLLSSLLNQNPRFYSGPSSPVVPTMLALENSLSQDELFLGYPKIDIARKMIASILYQYYGDVDKPVIIDKNRSWTIRMNYISGYFDIQPKVLCPVRDISEILTSFITMCRRNPFHVNGKVNFIDEMLIKSNIPLNDDSRCEFLAGPMGILGQSVDGIKKAIMEGYESSLHFVEYRDLVTNPQETMNKIYEFFEEDPFDHDFDNIKNINREVDGSIYGLADMHEVRPKLKSVSADPREILSESILEKCQNVEFWRELNNDQEENEDESEYNDEEVINLEYDNTSESNLIGSVKII